MWLNGAALDMCTWLHHCSARLCELDRPRAVAAQRRCKAGDFFFFFSPIASRACGRGMLYVRTHSLAFHSCPAPLCDVNPGSREQAFRCSAYSSGWGPGSKATGSKSAASDDFAFPFFHPNLNCTASDQGPGYLRSFRVCGYCYAPWQGWQHCGCALAWHPLAQQMVPGFSS